MVVQWVARCRKLLAENEELGAQLSTSRAEQAERSLAEERVVSAQLRELLDGPSVAWTARAPLPAGTRWLTRVPVCAAIVCPRPRNHPPLTADKDSAKLVELVMGELEDLQNELQAATAAAGAGAGGAKRLRPGPA